MTAETSPSLPKQAADQSQGLGGRAARGFVWTAGRTLFGRTMSLVSFVILARLLTKHDYGLAALATVFAELLMLVSTAGLGQALVQRAQVDRYDLDTTFWTTVGVGMVLTLSLFLAAWPLAAAFGEPTLRPILQALSVIFLVTGASSTHQAVLQRRLAFSAIAKTWMAGDLLATVVGIAFAFAGFGVWALVIQTVIAPIVRGTGLIVSSGYRPGLAVALARVPQLLRFSRNIVGIQFTMFLNMRTDDLLIGKFRGATALGVYAVGYRILTVLISVLVAGTQGVMVPAFARIHGDPARVGPAYLKATRLTAMMTFPVFPFLAVTAPELVHLVFGAKWAAAAPIMRVLCLVGPIYALSQLNIAVLTSLGRPHVAFRLQAVGTVLQIAAFLVAVQYGIVWVAASFVMRAYVMAPVELWIVLRGVGCDVKAFLRGLLPTLGATTLLVGAIVALRVGLPALSGALLLPASAAVAAVVYATAMRLLSPANFAEARQYARVMLPFR